MCEQFRATGIMVGGLIAMGLCFGGGVQLARGADKRRATGHGESAQLVETRPGCDIHEGNDPSRKEAKAAFEQGRAAFEVGDYQSAITHWKLSYGGDCTAHALLYNIALAYERLDDVRRAVTFYRAYLDRQQDASDREQVLEHIENLEQRIVDEDKRNPPPSQEISSDKRVQQTAAQAAALQQAAGGSGVVSAKPVSASRVSMTSDGSSHSIPVAPWVLVGVGGAAMVTGAVLLGIGSKAVSDAEAKCPGRVCETDNKAVQEGNNGRTVQGVGGVGLGVGALTVAGGLTWYFVAKPSSSGSLSKQRRAAATVFPAIGHGIVGFGVCGTL